MILETLRKHRYVSGWNWWITSAEVNAQPVDAGWAFSALERLHQGLRLDGFGHGHPCFAKP